MDANSLHLLEWPAVVSVLARCARTVAGQDRCLEVVIGTDAAAVAQSLELTQEAREIERLTGGIPVGGICDLRQSLVRVRQGGVLDASSVCDIASTLEAANRIREFLECRQAVYPQVASLRLPLLPLPELQAEIHRCLEMGGHVKDEASGELAKIRSNIQRLQMRVKSEVQRLLLVHSQHLQEDLVTVRGDRYVLPVRATHKSRVPGLLHDHSASGQTVFIEPLALVELGNTLQEAKLDERDEIASILARLTHEVAARLPTLQAIATGLAELDFVSARARLSDRWKGHLPRIVREGLPSLLQARHPLLVEEGLGSPSRQVVPIDLKIETAALLVTGINAGGKTSALKTLGLSILLAQAGIHPPVAAGSQSVVYEQLFADIGDGQDLKSQLSTFSGHMCNIIRILEACAPRTLILLDELGTGTDPAEGAALARATLEELVGRGAHVVATTHLAELKVLGHQNKEVSNASVEFDPKTLEPRYCLLFGNSGQSNAISTARRLGYPPQLATQAESYWQSGAKEAARLVHELERALFEAESAQAIATREKLRAEALRTEFEAKLANWPHALKELKRSAEAELRSTMKALELEIKAIITELKGSRSGQATQRAGERLRQVKAQIGGRDFSGPKVGTVKPGDEVYVPQLGQRALVLRIPGPNGMVAVRVGLLNLSVKLADLESPNGRPKDDVSKSRRRNHRPSTGFSPVSANPLEVDLRGLQVHEALSAVERFLDTAWAPGHPRLSLIHGAGTGALRKAVRQYLKTSPYAEHFRPGRHGEGGDGVTIIEG